MMSKTRFVVVNAVLCGVYFGAAEFGLSLAMVHPNATAVWPPAGIALAAVLVLGPSACPGIFIGAFLANILTAGSVATSLMIAAGNTLEGLGGAWLVNRYAGGSRAFDTPRGVFKFALLAALGSTVISATLGTASLAAGGVAPWSRFGQIWLTWWLGDAAGDMLVAPLLLLWFSSGPPRWGWSRLVEALALLGSLLCVGQIIFGGWILSAAKNYPLDFLCIPIMVWTAFRFGPRETATVLFLLAVLSIRGTLRGFGPFVRDDPNESLLLLQAFLGVSWVTAMSLAADVRRRREAEEALRGVNNELESRVAARTEELARANAELSLFASVASHELQEPLRKLVMFGDLLDSGQGGPGQENLDYARRMKDAARRMQKLVENILNLSRVTGNAAPLEPVDLGETVRQAAAEYQARVEASGGRFEIGPLPVLRGDPAQMRGLFENLISNACKFSKKEGPTVIRIFCGMPEKGFVDIFVSDNGIGFEEQYSQRIFKPFMRLHRRTDYEGSGIGLAICSRIAMRHGGAICAQSKPGEGSTFTVTLPVSAPAVNGNEKIRGA